MARKPEFMKRRERKDFLRSLPGTAVCLILLVFSAFYLYREYGNPLVRIYVKIHSEIYLNTEYEDVDFDVNSHVVHIPGRGYAVYYSASEKGEEKVYRNFSNIYSNSGKMLADGFRSFYTANLLPRDTKTNTE